MAVVDHVDTDLTLGDLLLLVPTCFRVGAEGIERYAITREMTEPLAARCCCRAGRRSAR